MNAITRTLVLSFFTLLLHTLQAQVQPACPNANFAMGGFNNWQGFTGDFNNPFNIPGIVSGRHTLITSQGTDPYSCGGLPLLPSGASVVARLGDNNTNAQGEALRFPMTVSNDNSLLIYKYAAVLEDPGHQPNEQPKLTIKVLDQSNNQIGGTCGVYDVYAGQTGQNFQTCNGVAWLPWATAAVDLSAFIGQTIQIEFSTRDCSLGGHFGYAYLTMSCQPLNLNLQYCQGSNSASIVAPSGFSSYLWSTGETTQTISVPNPTYGAVYSCELTTVTNTGTCTVNVDVTVQPTIIVPDYTYTQPCGALSLQFTNMTTVNNNNTIIANLWNFGDGGTSTQSNPSHVYTTPGTYDVRLISYASSGCKDTIIQQVVVKSIPTAGFSAPNTCEFDTVHITNTSTDLINQPMTYDWDFGDGATSTMENPTHVYTSDGTYTVTLIATNTDGCDNTRSMDITIYGLPQVDAGADIDACPYTPVTMAGSGADTYDWSNNVTDNTPFIPTTDGFYYVHGTDAQGCVNVDSLLLTFLPSPTISGGPDVTVCENTPVTFTGSGGDSYNWSNGIPDGQAYTPNVGSYTLIVQGYDASNCFGLDTVLLVVNPLPNVDAGPDQTICEGASTVLAGSGAQTYDWDNGVVDNTSFTPTATMTYTVTGTSAEGCQNTDQVDVVIEDPIAILIGTDSEQGCEPYEANLYNLSTGTTAVSSVWSFGDGSTTSDLSDTLGHTYNNAGCYDVTLTSTTALGCVWDSTFIDFICVYPNPTANFTPNPGVISVIGPDATMHNTSSGANFYIWDFGDGSEVSNDVNPTHTFIVEPEQNFQVTLIAISDHGCVDSITKVILMEKGVIMYVPNAFTPDGNQFNPVFLPIITSGVDKNQYQLEIYDRWGELIFKTNDVNEGWDGTYSGMICHEGLYTWKITYKTSSSDEKQMKTGHVNLLR